MSKESSKMHKVIMKKATNAEEHYKKMTETPVAKLIVTLGIPTTISMLISNIYNMVDTYFVGTLGESQQAATGILFTLQAIIQSIAFMFGQGSGTLVSKALADKNEEEASSFVSTAFFVSGAIGLVFSVFGLIFLKPLMLFLGSTNTILPYAMDYGMWVFISCPFQVCALVMNNNLRYEGKAFYSMIGLATGGILNIFGDYIFIRIFNLGVYGAGMSTAISQVVSFLLLLYYYKRMAQSEISYKFISRKAKDLFAIVKVGFPAFVRQGFASISHGVLNNLTKPFGDAAIAAMSVVNRFSSFVMCVGLGVGQGFQPVASFNYQAKKYKRVKQGLVLTTVIGFCMISVFSTLGIIFAEEIVYLFQKSEAVNEVGVTALRYAAIGVLFHPLAVPVNMLYQSIRRPLISTILSMFRSGLALIPTLFITTHLWGLTGVMVSQPISDIITAFVSLPFGIYFLFKTPNE